MDDERIKRIARAMCRAARLDPDKPVDSTQLRKLALAGPPVETNASPAWTLFLQRAQSFVTAHSEVAEAL